MSATNRSSARKAHPNDFYPTPSWATESFLKSCPIPLEMNRWLEPCAGTGAIIRAVAHEAYFSPIWHAIDLTVPKPADIDVYWQVGDFLTIDAPPSGFDAVVTNPPYSLAEEFIKRCWNIPYICMLLRLNFMGSQKRKRWLQQSPPDIYVLPKRPSFTDDGRTDGTEYGWFVWPPEKNRLYGRVQVLDV